MEALKLAQYFDLKVSGPFLDACNRDVIKDLELAIIEAACEAITNVRQKSCELFGESIAIPVAELLPTGELHIVTLTMVEGDYGHVIKVADYAAEAIVDAFAAAISAGFFAGTEVEVVCLDAAVHCSDDDNTGFDESYQRALRYEFPREFVDGCCACGHCQWYLSRSLSA